MEVEAKLTVGDPEIVRGVIEGGDPAQLAGFVPSGGAHLVVVLDRYLDTALETEDGLLFAAGMKARTRTDERGGIVVTVKGEAALTGSVASREELEGPATASLVPSDWPGSVAQDRILGIVGSAALVQTVSLRQNRLTRLLVRDDTVVELSLDELEALDGDEVVGRRWELEAELKAGPEGPLHDLTAALSRLRGVTPATISKRTFATDAVRAGRSGRR